MTTQLTRQLCYEHHCSEFDTLPNVRIYEASYWRTVSADECEICWPAAAERDRLRQVNAELVSALEQCITALSAATCTCNDDRDCQRCHAARKARAAVRYGRDGRGY